MLGSTRGDALTISTLGDSVVGTSRGGTLLPTTLGIFAGYLSHSWSKVGGSRGTHGWCWGLVLVEVKADNISLTFVIATICSSPGSFKWCPGGFP